MKNVIVITVDDFEKLTTDYLSALERTYRPNQIMVELNGMWLVEQFSFKSLPRNWSLQQSVCIVDATTFAIYAKNMPQLIMEKIKIADMIIINRCTSELAAGLRKRNLSFVNRHAEIILEYADGRTESYYDGTISAFDLTKDIIDISDDDYGIWYAEVMSKTDMYVGKRVHYRGSVYKYTKSDKNLTVGRFCMTCCENDISYLGITCELDRADDYDDKDWVEITGIVQTAYLDLYEETGPVIFVESIQPTEKPQKDVVSFL